jgi:carboxylesterase type B
MGESSGAGSVSAHLTAPKSFGLFQSAAMSSGAFGTWISAAMSDAQTTYDELVRESRCSVAQSPQHGRSVSSTRAVERGGIATDELACLRALPLNTLLNFSSVKNSSAYGPVVDGVELTDTPLQLLRQGKVDRGVRAVIMGSMAEDSGVALKGFASEGHRFSELFPARISSAGLVCQKPLGVGTNGRGVWILFTA